MLIGRFDGKIDDKSRIAFPRKFRDALGSTLIVTYGFEGSLIVIAQEHWQVLLRDVENQPLTKNIGREMRRYLVGSAHEIELDTKGRLLLPSYLKDHAQLTNDVIFLGLTKYIELWDKQRWEEHQTTITKSISFIAERLGEQQE